MRHVNTLFWCRSARRELIGSTIFLLLVTSAVAQTAKVPSQEQVSAREVMGSAASQAAEGDRLLCAGNVKAAAASYLQAAKAAPTQPLYQITAGVALASAGRMNEALAAFRRADNLAKGGDVIASFLVQGILSERSEDSEESQALYTRTVRRFSRPGVSGLDTSSSTAQLRAAQKQFPQSPILWLLLGDSYQLAEQWSNAETSYRQAILLAPSWVKPRINLGLGQLAQGRSSQAIASFQGALDLDPANTQAQIAKADAQLQSGFVDDAVLSYRKVENSTNNRVAAQAATGIGQAYAQRGQVNEAVKSLNRAKELSPLDPAPAAAIGVVQAQAGNYSAAAQAYGEALRLSRGGLFASKGVLYRALAETQISARNSDGAISTLNRALVEEPSNKPLWYRLWAQALFLRNDTSGGEEKLKQALESEGSRYPLEVLNALDARHLIDKLTSEYLTNLSVAKDRTAKIRLLRPLISLIRFQDKPAAEIRSREMLVALKPTGPEWFGLAEAKERNGDITGARSAYQKAVGLGGLAPTALKKAKDRIAGRIAP
jgi:tetratricopeptide (TPR) repeat protein